LPLHNGDGNCRHCCSLHDQALGQRWSAVAADRFKHKEDHLC
jgi:hypothetical protein